MKDWQLLQQWVEHRSETAFAQLVDRHIDFVHNCDRLGLERNRSLCLVKRASEAMCRWISGKSL